MDLDAQLRRLESRVDRQFQHFENVMATQREIVQKAFDQVNLAFLEQEMGMRALSEGLKESLGEMLHVIASERAETADELKAIQRRLDALENPPAA